MNAVDAYTSFLNMTGGTWDPPRYKASSKLPFIPKEEELDALIAGCGPKTSTFLQLLKETGMRAGEAHKLRWADVDFENCTVRVTPEKGSNPRIFKISRKLLNMLVDLKATSRVQDKSRVFAKDLRTIRSLREAKSQHRKETQEPKAAAHPLPHLPTLESNDAVSSDQGHPIRNAVPRAQEHTEHAHLHSA